MLHGAKLQNSTKYEEFQKTNENTTARATNEDKFSKNTSGNVATQCRGGEAAKAKQKEEKIINKIGMDAHTRGSHWSSGDVDFPFKVFIGEGCK